jgi:hypothetical protein
MPERVVPEPIATSVAAVRDDVFGGNETLSQGVIPSRLRVWAASLRVIR